MNILKLRESKWGNYRGEIRYRTFKFPDGQPHLELESTPTTGEYLIQASLTSLDSVFEVMMARDALSNNQQVGGVGLEVHYLLGARMDRYMSERWPRTLGLVASMLNSCGFGYVHILDPHSEAATSLIAKSQGVLPHRAFQRCMNELDPEYVVIPDLGAVNRVSSLLARSRQAQTVGLVQAAKQREPLTGKLRVSDQLLGLRRDFGGATVLIADDLCDGGATFVELARVLSRRGAGEIGLFVTHGIFSRGPAALAGIDRIWTTDSYRPALYDAAETTGFLTTYNSEDEF